MIIGDDGKQIPSTVDARAWTSEWMETIRRHPGVPTDEGTMIGWFANAIMAGHDEAQRREKAAVVQWFKENKGNWHLSTESLSAIEQQVMKDFNYGRCIYVP